LYLATAVLAASVVAAEADPPSLEKVQTITLKGPAGGLDHLAVDAKRGRLFVANTVNGSLDIVDLKAGKLIKQVPGQGKIRGVAYSPEVDRVFVGNGEGGMCNTFDGGTYELLKSVPLGIDADNVRFDPRRQTIYVVHADTDLAVIDGKDYTLRKSIALPESLGAFQLESGRPRMYLNAKGDTEKDKVIGQFPVAPAGVNAALAIDEPNHRILVGCRRNPALVVMDSDTGKIVATVPIPGDVDDVYFDAKRNRIYASCGEGAIAVIRRIDAGRYEPLATIRTTKGARTSVFHPDAGYLYLSVPRRADQTNQEGPEIWVYRVHP
jgi:DNA-binding beta-propeller fold protein YncE